MTFGLLSEERETHVLGLLRLAFAALLLKQTFNRARELGSNGYFGDFFHMSLWPESFVPSATAYAVLLGLQAFSCVLALLGVLARPALLLAASLGLFCFFCDRLQYHNNRYQLLLLTFLVALTPCDRSFLPLRAARPGPGPRWAARLVGAQVSIVYLASSLGKLFDPDWRGGTVMLLRFGMGRARLTQYVPPAVADLIHTPAFAHAASLAAIAKELFLAIGLWHPRTRALALWLGVMFHIGIELSANVELFSYTMLCGYLAFVRPELAERRISWRDQAPWTRLLAPLFAKLDVLRRFDHQPASAQSALLITRTRDGKEHQGLAAWRELSRAMPPLFPFWLPLWLLTLKKR